MAKIVQQPRVDVSATLSLDESELRALDAMTGYSVESFIKCFYTHLGKHYLEPHEAGLRSFFASVRKEVPPILRRMEDAREVFSGRKKAVEDRDDG